MYAEIQELDAAEIEQLRVKNARLKRLLLSLTWAPINPHDR
jgi:hypothetical protein